MNTGDLGHTESYLDTCLLSLAFVTISMLTLALPASDSGLETNQIERLLRHEFRWTDSDGSNLLSATWECIRIAGGHV